MKLLLSEVDFLRYKHFINLKNYIIYYPMLYSMGGGGAIDTLTFTPNNFEFSTCRKCQKCRKK